MDPPWFDRIGTIVYGLYEGSTRGDPAAGRSGHENRRRAAEAGIQDVAEVQPWKQYLQQAATTDMTPASMTRFSEKEKENERTGTHPHQSVRMGIRPG